MKAIYQIRNTGNGKSYIGGTSNFAIRVCDHKSKLKKNIHSNPKMQADYNDFSAKFFEYEVISELDKDSTKQEILDSENEYIQRYKPEYNKVFRGSLFKSAAKLTAKEVLEIRERYKPHIVTMRALAEKYEVKRETIQSVLYRRNWKDI